MLQPNPEMYLIIDNPEPARLAEFARDSTPIPMTALLARIERMFSQPISDRALAAVRGEIPDDEEEESNIPRRKAVQGTVNGTPQITRHFRYVHRFRSVALLSTSIWIFGMLTSLVVINCAFRSVILTDADFVNPVADASKDRERALISLLDALRAF